MIEQAQVFKDIPNVTIKVPCTVEGLKACKALAAEGFTTNVTLVLSSVAQLFLLQNQTQHMFLLCWSL